MILKYSSNSEEIPVDHRGILLFVLSVERNEN